MHVGQVDMQRMASDSDLFILDTSIHISKADQVLSGHTPGAPLEGQGVKK